jgi:hypothetical protein
VVYFDFDEFLNQSKDNERFQSAVDSNNNNNQNNANAVSNGSSSAVISSFNFNFIKNELIANIQQKLLNLSNDKSAIVLLENFHSFFSTSDLSTLAVEFLNELLFTRKKLE